MSRSAHFSFALLLVTVGGCQSSPVASGGYAVTSCSSSGDCTGDAACVRDHCPEAFASDADCSSGALCACGACFAPPSGV